MPFKAPKWAAMPLRRNSDARLDVEKEGEIIENIKIGYKACTLLGRKEELCDAVLQHPSVSRQHAAIIHDADGAIYIMDLKSAQGTFVNAKEISPETPVQLQKDDRVQFGSSTRTYHFHNPVKPSEKEDSAPSIDEQLPAMPKSFGSQSNNEDVVTSTSKAPQQTDRQKREAEIAAMTAEMMSAPASVAPNAPAPEEVDNEEESSSESDEDVAKDDIASRYSLPISQQISLPGHSKAISCIAFDAPGARIATGSMDYDVKLWDFAGMERHVRPFRNIEVEEGNPLVALSYSPSGDRFLAATGSSQPKVLTREGVEEVQFMKGDMYVMDMANTKGHTHSVTGGMWNPKRKDQMMSSSLDGTIRIWDLNGKMHMEKLVNSQVLKVKSKQGKRTGVTACTYNLDGTMVIGGTMDGQIQCFDPRKAYAGSVKTIKNAHADGGGDLGISSLRFSPDGKMLASRSSSDDSIKLWDLRKPKDYVKKFSGIDSVFGTSNVAFNTIGTCLVAGTSVRKGKGERGRILFFDVHTPNVVDPISSLEVEQDESVICVEWHAGLNQVAIGGSSGTCKMLYDPQMSRKGAMLTATKKMKTRPVDSGVRLEEQGQVYNPNALPMYKDEPSKKRKYSKIRADPKASKIPEKPISGPGMGGRISGTSSFTQYYMSGHVKDNFREEDPREAILKYAKQAEEDPQFAAAAYDKATGGGKKVDKKYDIAQQTLEDEITAAEEEEKKLLNPLGYHE